MLLMQIEMSHGKAIISGDDANMRNFLVISNN